MSRPPPPSAPAPGQATRTSYPLRTTGNLFPLSSRLSTSDSPRLAEQDSADFLARGNSSAQRALSQRALLAARLDWVERFCEPGISLPLLRQAALELDTVTYDDLLHERHSLDLCPYPPCALPPAVPYAPSEHESVSLRVKLKSNGLYQQQGRGIGEAYCGKWCSARSEWYRGLIERGGHGELLEDVEVRRRETLRAPVERPVREDVVSLPMPPLPNDSPVTLDLLNSMTIKERPIPTEAPLAPRPSDSLVDFERPSVKFSPLDTATAPGTATSHLPIPILPRRRKPPNPAVALSPFSTTTLSASLLRASRSLTDNQAANPPPPPGVDPSAPAPRWQEIVVVGVESGADPYAGIVEEVDVLDEEEEMRLMDEAMEVRAMMSRGEL